MILPKDMDHNEFDFYDDLTTPFLDFLFKSGINMEMEMSSRFPYGRIVIPKEAFIPPQNLLD